MSLVESISHISWTLERSPKSYVVMRDALINLRILLVNQELQYQEREKQNGK